MKLRLVFSALAALTAALPLANGATRTVALSGQVAPGLPAGSNFTHLYYTPPEATGPVLNNAGRVAFSGYGAVSGGATYNGVWTDASGALALIARSGAQAPGASAGTNFTALRNPVLNSTGQVAFDATLSVPAVSNAGVWATDSGTLTLIARKGFAAAGAGAGVNYLAFFTPGMNDAGRMAFRAQIAGAGVTAGSDVGIWSGESDSLTLVAREGSAAPGAPAGVVFDHFPGTPILINDAGRIAFKGFLAGPGVSADVNRMGLWAERASGLELVARQGSPVPGVAGGLFEFLSDPSLNRNDRVAFVGLMTGVPVATNAAVFSDSSGSVAVVARRGSSAPGTPANFSTFTEPLLNGEGHVAFQAVLNGGGVTTANDTSLWSTSTGALNLVAREGAAAPGGAAGQTFSAFASPALNAAGQLAFTAALAGTGITTANDRGIWAQGLDGDLRLVAREGGALEVSPGVTRTIAELHYTAGANTEDGRRIGFNDYGEVAYLATFTDGSSGIFVSDVAKAAAGDFNGNGAFDGGDFLVWQRGVGRMVTGLPIHGDANGDGTVNGADLDVWKGNYGSTPAVAVSSVVPEPSALAIAAMALLTALSRRRI
jgi:hypothetical protein